MECFDKAIDFGTELNIKYNLCDSLNFKAELLYKINDFKLAKEFNDKSFSIAMEIEQYSTILKTKILNEKINFKLSDNVDDKFKYLANLEELLTDEDVEGNIAELNYEIALLLNELKETNYKYKNKALELYKKLYQEIPKIEYKSRCEELENM